MAFSKAKILRFNDIKSCAPPPGAYDPKFDDHVPGTIKFIKEKTLEPQSPASSNSDLRSVQSNISTQSFRTPTVPRRKKLLLPSSTGKTNRSVKIFSPRKSEALREKIVECVNKDETIKDLENQIEDLKLTISQLKTEKESLILERDEMKRQLKEEIEILKKKLKQNEIDKDTIVIELEEVKAKLETQNSSEMKILQENISYWEAQLKIHNTEAEIILKETEEKLENNQTIRCRLELELEQKEEKFRQLEILYIESQRANDELQKSHFSAIEALKKLQEAELENLENDIGKIHEEWNKTVEYIKIEYEQKIQQIEIEKENDIKRLQIDKEELENVVKELNVNITGFIEELSTAKYKLEKKTILHKSDIESALAEKHRYEITLNKTYETINALKKRLLNSDRDVEQLTKELENLEMAKFQIELTYMEENEKLKKTVEELKCDKNSLRGMNEKIAQLEIELVEKVDNFKANAEVRIAELNTIIDDKHKNLEELHSFIREQQNNCTTAYGLIADARTEIERLENELSEQKFIVSRLECRINDTQMTVDSLTETLEEKDKNIKELKDKLKERDLEMNEQASIYKKYIEKSRQEDELQQKYEELQLKCQELEKKIADQNALIGPFREQLENYERECQMLLLHKGEAEKEAKEMGLKYAEILGHQNIKQKLKHMVDLKKKNIELMNCKQEYETKFLQQNRTIEKLKQKISQINKTKTVDKENVGSPVRVQIISSRVDSPVNPLKERN